MLGDSGAKEDAARVKSSQTLKFAVGSAVIVWIVVTYYFQAPPWPALLGALGVIVWITSKAWRER